MDPAKTPKVKWKIEWIPRSPRYPGKRFFLTSRGANYRTVYIGRLHIVIPRPWTVAAAYSHGFSDGVGKGIEAGRFSRVA